MRPNIRIEIQNNISESMEVDENEEGEVSAEDDEPEIPQAKAVEDAELQPTVADRERLEERARRFHLNPGEVRNFTTEDLRNLYKSLGITSSNRATVRFDALHIRGMKQLDAKAITQFFTDFAPVSVEWIDEECCNVVWNDRESAARALHFTSKPVNGMPVRDDTGYFFPLDDTNLGDNDQLFANDAREVQLLDDSEVFATKQTFENAVDISEITSKIPPGHWRLANGSTSILLRFGLKNDKQFVSSESLARYYNTLKAKRHRGGIFARNKDIEQSERKDNPWSALAKNWDEDVQFRENEAKYVEPRLHVKNPRLKVRLGNKGDEVVEIDDNEPAVRRPKKLRMKMYADEEEEKIKRKKMLKKIDTQIQHIDETSVPNTDLRRILNLNSHTNAARIERTQSQVDLGSTLRNRRQKMVFEVQTELEMDKVAHVTRYKDRDHERPHRDARQTLRRDREYPDEGEAFTMRSEKPSRRDAREKLRREYDEYEDEEFTMRSEKPRSKVALVIKTQKRPTVASTVASSVWSRVSKPPVNQPKSSSSEDQTSSSSDSESAEDEEEEEEDEEEEDAESDTAELRIRPNVADRPGFQGSRTLNQKTPLKIEISNDQFARK